MNQSLLPCLSRITENIGLIKSQNPIKITNVFVNEILLLRFNFILNRDFKISTLI